MIMLGIRATTIKITDNKITFKQGKVLSFTKTADYLAYSKSVTNICRVDGFKINWK